MGRTLKRVPLDFKWIQGQVWKGYLNPYLSFECKACDGEGLNRETLKISKEWYNSDNPRYVYISSNRRYNDNAWSYHITDIEVDALMKAGRLRDLSGFRGWFDEEKNSWITWKDGEKIVCDKPEYPTAEQVNEWNKTGFGHDAINKWVCVQARAHQLGVYGKCEFCVGEGVIWQSEEIKKLHEEWQRIEPPAGEGYQLWETTSEGSPDSPVFKTLDELCEWCEDNATTFADFKATKQDWLKMLSDDNVIHKEGNVIFL